VVLTLPVILGYSYLKGDFDTAIEALTNIQEMEQVAAGGFEQTLSRFWGLLLSYELLSSRPSLPSLTLTENVMRSLRRFVDASFSLEESLAARIPENYEERVSLFRAEEARAQESDLLLAVKHYESAISAAVNHRHLFIAAISARNLSILLRDSFGWSVIASALMEKAAVYMEQGGFTLPSSFLSNS
jgi:hypothetical protein